MIYTMLENTESFYKKAASYWASVPATVNGVLCGYAHISDIDIEGSKDFLGTTLSSNTPPNTNLALDCGAGIGRVTKGLLINYFDKVDVVEQDAKFINTVKHYVGDNNGHLGALYQISLQDFKPEKVYDVIWCQWVLGHINDHDFISFFKRCGKALAKDGVIFVKENITNDEDIDFDDDDCSVTRPYSMILKLFDAANLRLLRSEVQLGFPDNIYPVHMFALKPKNYTINPS